MVFNNVRLLTLQYVFQRQLILGLDFLPAKIATRLRNDAFLSPLVHQSTQECPQKCGGLVWGSKFGPDGGMR